MSVGEPVNNPVKEFFTTFLPDVTSKTACVSAVHRNVF